MEPIRYRPGEAIRWLESGAKDIRKEAARKGKSLVRREGQRTVGRDLKDAAGALFEMGRSALADLAHHQAQATEYVLHEKKFEVVKPSGSKSVAYDTVKSMKVQNDRATLVLEQGSVHVKPHAYIVAGRIRVPVGWTRNGMEVPYETLLEELAARCRVNIEHL
ncbi:MAG: hypothetical protein M9921_08200 [Fimbriimonadaceae bacterium]|nr:hypothetical protein [Chthonomonadaceae bacterium]MCO5296824.1 hypothetical protein [Fimbriimonadaceae bacterium]